jgi:hypothetical protein
VPAHRRLVGLVVTRPSTGYLWRKDTDDIASALAEALADYRARHGQ